MNDKITWTEFGWGLVKIGGVLLLLLWLAIGAGLLAPGTEGEPTGYEVCYGSYCE